MNNESQFVETDNYPSLLIFCTLTTLRLDGLQSECIEYKDLQSDRTKTPQSLKGENQIAQGNAL